MNLMEENRKQLKMMRENFRFLRTERNWSIEELSDISGIDKKILADIEEGQDFEVDYLIQLCYIYDIKPAKIFFPIIE